MNILLFSGLNFLIASFLITSGVASSEIKYKVSEIPKDLLKDSKAVIRNSEVEFIISDIGKAVKKVNYAITILNENGINNSVFFQFYDKFSTIRKVQAKLYNQNGEPIRNGPNIEVKDYSAIAGYSLYEDNRVKFLDPKYRTTPFTVEFSYEITYNGLFNYPDWYTCEDYNISVERSKFTVITPPGFKFRHKEQNLADSCRILNHIDKTEYIWEVTGLPAVRKEPFSINLVELIPVVSIAPNDFEISGSKGNCESWNNLGKWIYKLGEGRNVLPPETNATIKSMISGLDNDYDKIKALYNYLQNKVRYVSIQIGLGGWQTIEASTVDRLSYGDCKALSNYMKSLLDVAGIKSFYTLVMAGDDSPLIKEDFPSNQFNHAILCVPMGRDTIWLECTSQNIPFGYIGTFTDDRKVLVLNEAGGRIVSTKRYSIEDNNQIRSASVELGPTGNANATVRTDYKGTLYDGISAVLHMDEKDRLKFVQSRIAIPSFNLISFSHKEQRNIVPVITENLNLSLLNYGTIIGNRILINPNLMTRFGKLPYRTKDRKSVISIRRPYIEKDTIILKVPVNYKMDPVPEKISVISKFGEYTVIITCNKNVIIYSRLFKFFNGNYPVSDYNGFVDFCEKVSASDERKIVLVKSI